MQKENHKDKVLYEIMDHLENGLVTEVFNAEKARQIYNILADYSESINNGDISYRTLFSSLQIYSLNEVYNAMYRLYDYHRNSRSILPMLNKWNKNAKWLPDVDENINIKNILKELDIPENIITLVNNDGSLFAKEISTYCKIKYNSPDNKSKIEKLNKIRNTRLAHNAQSIESNTIDWNSVDNFAKKIIGVLGWGYFNTFYYLEGVYRPTIDAERQSFLIINILEDLKYKSNVGSAFNPPESHQ